MWWQGWLGVTQAKWLWWSEPTNVHIANFTLHRLFLLNMKQLASAGRKLQEVVVLPSVSNQNKTQLLATSYRTHAMLGALGNKAQRRGSGIKLPGFASIELTDPESVSLSLPNPYFLYRGNENNSAYHTDLKRVLT